MIQSLAAETVCVCVCVGHSLAQAGQMDYSKAWEQYYKKLGKSTHTDTHMDTVPQKLSTALTEQRLLAAGTISRQWLNVSLCVFRSTEPASEHDDGLQ